MSGPLLFPETSPLEIVLRAAVIYLFLLLAFRLLGSHEFGQMMTMDDLLESLREEGVLRLDEVKVAYLESDGKVSVIKHKKERESTRGNDKDLF